uniref:Non-specific lipid-transfer protein 3 n=1 Tax=Cajanus cajan TaxID=3821 RepID=A0A151T9V7_CAJCA|nr:Non-specific lipid-transfer protein 3 [Cajanus cajan]
MGSAAVTKASWLGVVACMMALGAPFAAMGEFTCCEVKPVLDACGSYVKMGGDTIPLDCCMNVLTLRNTVMNSSENQRLACHCIQDAALKVPHINVTAYGSLPFKCGVNLPYQFSLTMRCDKYVT